MEELRSLNHDLAELGKRLLVLDEDQRGRELKLTELRRRFEQATEKLTAQLDHASKVHLVPQVKKVLEEYKVSLIHKKVLEFQEAVTECFQTLCRKKDSLGRIIVDPNDFSVTLQDKHNRPLPKAQLSAGEKQIYAISMLWALAKTSGRPLPIIIDTPLARLDSDHRKLLAQHYFPFASHQVLILSTDTEVDQSYFEELTDLSAKPTGSISIQKKMVQRSHPDTSGDMLVKITRLRFTKEASNRLRFAAGKTGLTPNLLCRLGFALSLPNRRYRTRRTILKKNANSIATPCSESTIRYSSRY